MDARTFRGVANSVSQVFLDGSSGEPMLPQVHDSWVKVQRAGWGDPLRLHRPGRLAAQALDQARELVALAVGARPEEVVFTGSGAQASHAAIAGLALGRTRTGSVIITSAVDHSSVLAAASAYGSRVEVGVDSRGRINLTGWQQAVRETGVAAACLQVANHEVGTLQPFREGAEICERAGVPLVLDATTALGRVDLADAGPWSALTGAASAFGGPVGVGFMVIRKGARWRAPYPTDDYQAGRWPGVPDVPAIYVAAVALEVWLHDGAEVGRRQTALVERLRRGLASVPEVEVVGDPEHRVPHLLTFSALYVDGETLTLELDRAGFAVASGSACSASSEHPSHVLAAMGALTHGNVRIGLTRATTEAEVDAFLEAVPPIVAEIRARLGAP